MRRTDRAVRTPSARRRSIQKRCRQKRAEQPLTRNYRACASSSLFSPGLSQHVLDHAPGDVGEPKIAARVTEGQPRVVDAEQVQNGGVEIVDVHLVRGDLDAVVV